MVSENSSSRTTVQSILPDTDKGQHGLIVGQNGSGKTEFAKWMLQRLENSPTIIYDTKGEIEGLPGQAIVSNIENVAKAVDDERIDYIIFRPPVRETSDPEQLDRYLMIHYDHFKHVTAYIDEIYSFHKGSRPGPGLTALLTRGRSRKISTIMSTQRPRHLSTFAITEARHFYVFDLTFRDDRKRMGDAIPGYEDTPRLPPYHFLYYKSGAETYQIFKPVPVTPVKPELISEDAQQPARDVQRRLTWV